MDINVEKDLSILTPRQKEVFLLYASGKTCVEIARILGCSKQNASALLHAAKRKLENPPQKKAKPRADKPSEKTKKTCLSCYEKYQNCSLDVLTEREREIFSMKLSGMTYSQIAQQVGITSSGVGVLLKNARDRLEGRKTGAEIWNEKNQDKIKSYRKSADYAIKQSERHKKYAESEKNKEKMQKYYKEWYQKNRERILEKQRNARQNKKALLDK